MEYALKFIMSLIYERDKNQQVVGAATVQCDWTMCM